MRKSRLLLSGVIAGVITVALTALLLSHTLGAAHPTATFLNGVMVISPTPQCPGPLYQSDGGGSAIPPRNNCTPSFTVQDALDYEHTHPFGNMRMVSIGQPKVTKVLFITSAQASQRIGGAEIGLPDDALVCYVELYGTYRFMPPFGVQGGTHSGTMHDIFDAHTGTLLVSGG